MFKTISTVVLLAFCFSLAKSPGKYIFKGTYELGHILSELCQEMGCSVGLSGEYVSLPVMLSVKTSSPTVLLSSIRSALSMSGLFLQGSFKSSLTLTRDFTENLSSYIDANKNVQTVPKHLLSIHKKADSLRSLRQPSERWRLQYISVSKKLLDSYGFDVLHPLSYGETFSFNLFDTWNFDYISSRDSLFESRNIYFDLDSNSIFSWGIQKQVPQQTFSTGETIQTNYEWRQYGIDIDIKRFPTFKLSYTIRSPDESTITGNSSLGQDSTIFIVANYSAKTQGKTCFLPLIPIFCKPTYTTEERYIIIRLFKSSG